LLICCVEGPSIVGNGLLAREGMLDMIIAMADSGSAVHVVSSTMHLLAYCTTFICHIVKLKICCQFAFRIASQ